MELAAGQHGLEHVACVHGALGPAGADDVVQLVDKEQYPALARLDLGKHGLQALLEFAPVLGPGNQGTHVQGEDGLVLEPLGHVPAHDPLGQAFHNGRLAHAGFADEHRVVLGLSGKDAHHAPDLGVAPDDRVELAELGLGHQVDAVLFQGLVGGLGVVAGHALVAPYGGQCLQQALLGDLELGKDLCCG